MFENKILRKIFGPKKKRVNQVGEWRKLHNVEFHNLYGNVDLIRLQWAGHVARMGDAR
mgnify:CR=1 FL=1